MPFDGTESERVSEALREARRLLTERGWCQGIMQDQVGRLCLFGAIREATHGWDGNPIYGMAWNRVGVLLGSNEVSPWNDAPGRTKAEVLDLLDRAAHTNPLRQKTLPPDKG